MQSAVQHARIYCVLINGYTPEKHRFAEPRSHQNVGMLYEVLGEYTHALIHYQQYLRMSKEKGHAKGIAQAYGCLGSVYAQLNNRELSLTYHEQHLNNARKLGEQTMVATALELAGDSLLLMDDYEGACAKYDLMFQNCPRMDLKMRTTSLCKLGSAYRQQKRFQYALFYFEQAREIADDFDFMNVKVMCDFNMACMMQHSTQHSDLDKAFELFRKLIPVLEAKFVQHQEEDTFCPTQLNSQIQQCYNGIQQVLAKLGNGNLCLQYSEAQKKKYMTQVTQAQTPSGMTYSISNIALFDAWSVEKMTRVVNQQNATVLMYHLLHNQLLLWLLKPGEGVKRFYTGKGYESDTSVREELCQLIAEVRDQRDTRQMQYECENRSLTFKDYTLTRTRQANKKLAASYRKEQYRKELAEEVEEKEKAEREAGNNKQLEVKKKPALRRLFDILISPVYDLIEGAEDMPPLVIIPDKDLSECPFAVLRDWQNRSLDSQLRITVCPSLYALDCVVQNELNQLKIQDDLEFERTQARLGGIPKIMQNIDFLRLNMGSPDYICLPDGHLESRTVSKDKLKLRCVANPRLVTSGALPVGNTADAGVGVNKEATLLSMKSKSSLNSAKNAPFSPRTKRQLGSNRFVPSDSMSRTKTILTGAPTSIGKQ